MAMDTLITVAAGIAVVNLGMLLALIVVWARNYSTFRSGLVLGLIVFALAMLAENAVAVYFFFSMQSFYGGDPHVQEAVLVLRAIQFVAISVLTYVTLK